MRLMTRIGPVLAGLVAMPALSIAATIGGNFYAPQYDYRESFAATGGRNLAVVLAGTAFPSIDPAVVARDLLPAMQRAKPRPALTFTYDRPLRPPSPDYRLVQVFDPANNLNAVPVCAGAGSLLRLCDLLPERPSLVVYHGMDTGDRSHRSAHRTALPRTVHGGFLRPAAAIFRRGSHPHSVSAPPNS